MQENEVRVALKVNQGSREWLVPQALWDTLDKRGRLGLLDQLVTLDPLATVVWVVPEGNPVFRDFPVQQARQESLDLRGAKVIQDHQG
jgi:hypothetical protein